MFHLIIHLVRNYSLEKVLTSSDVRMIQGSGGLGNKKMYSDYVRVGREWII